MGEREREGGGRAAKGFKQFRRGRVERERRRARAAKEEEEKRRRDESERGRKNSKAHGFSTRGSPLLSSNFRFQGE